MEGRKKILVAPLNWGLGHATRDIPVIRQLLSKPVDIIIAGDGRPLELLRKEFPQLKWIRFPGFEVKYHHSRNLAIQVIFQLPKFISSYSKENHLLEKIIKEEKIDAVISDNRYGLYSKKIRSVFVTHQTGIIMPVRLKWIELLVNNINRKAIEKFDECWIPDDEGENNLSGDLSHKYSKPANAKFIGPLSRFCLKKVKKEYDILIVLSGPESQRSILEKILIDQVKQLISNLPHDNNGLEKSFKVLMIKGIPEGSNYIHLHSENFFFIDFMTSVQLNESILASDVVISRPGYSTIMDIVTLGKRAIFIPTPGQTEQEYLAQYHKQQRNFYSENQKNFNLKRALKESEKYLGMKSMEKDPIVMK